MYCWTFRRKPVFDLLRIFEPNPDAAAAETPYVNPDPHKAYVMRLCVALTYNAELICLQADDRAEAHVPEDAGAGAAAAGADEVDDDDEDEDAPEDADVPAEPDNAAGQAVEEALYADAYDPTFNRARRFGKNERLTSIKTGMCLVGGRWLSSAPNSSEKEAELGTHMTDLSASFWAPRIESPRDTFQILHVSQVEGKAWGRPFWYDLSLFNTTRAYTQPRAHPGSSQALPRLIPGLSQAYPRRGPGAHPDAAQAALSQDCPRRRPRHPRDIPGGGQGQLGDAVPPWFS